MYENVFNFAQEINNIYLLNVSYIIGTARLRNIVIKLPEAILFS